MRWCFALVVIVTLAGCASNNPDVPSVPATAAPVWEPARDVAAAGPGYPIPPRRFGYGGPQSLTVNQEGWAFVGALEAFAEQGFLARVRGWGNAYDPRGGWQTAVRLPVDPDLLNANDSCNGIGLTPDGALFGWSRSNLGSSTSYGLRGFDVRRGWLAPGTLSTFSPQPRASLMTTARDGIPVVAYAQSAQTFFLRHTGVLEGPELVFGDEQLYALSADDAGDVAVASFRGSLAVRAPDGRWVQTRIPPTQAPVAIAPMPGGGFLVAWYEQEGDVFVNELVRYKAATVDAAGRLSAITELGSAPAAPLDPIFGRSYDAAPQAAAGPASAAVVAWRGDRALFVARATGGRWDPAERVPNAAPDTGVPAATGFGVTMDASATALLVWNQGGGLSSAQQRAGQAWSAAASVASSGVATTGVGNQSVLLATNASGTAFAAWRSGERVMAARSPSR